MELHAKQFAGTALIELKKRLAEEDLQQQGAGVSFPHGFSPSTFLQCALEVETTQYVHVLIPSECY